MERCAFLSWSKSALQGLPEIICLGLKALFTYLFLPGLNMINSGTLAEGAVYVFVPD